jgi:cytoskeleton protein RodZ
MDVTAASARPGPSAGAKLKAAREAAGLSIDAVAQQLKLAPRQVTALEQDDFQRLPGRTFVRGFARNYARFVQLDPDAVLALLPAGDAPALQRPALSTSRRPMGEMPVERVAKRSAARWLIPLLVLVLVGAAAFYEFSGSLLHWLPRVASTNGADGTSTAAAHAAAPAATPGTVTTALPNPVSETTSSTDAKDAGAAPASAAASTAAAPPTTADASAATPAANASATGGGLAAEVPLILTFKGTSWAEVKDATGRVVLQMTGGPGMTQTVSGVPPLELTLGNATLVDATFRGQALDLTPYTRGGVARVALK